MPPALWPVGAQHPGAATREGRWPPSDVRLYFFTSSVQGCNVLLPFVPAELSSISLPCCRTLSPTETSWSKTCCDGLTVQFVFYRTVVVFETRERHAET